VPKHLLHKLEGPDVTITKMDEVGA
jgi:hypothetical protein